MESQNGLCNSFETEQEASALASSTNPIAIVLNDVRVRSWCHFTFHLGCEVGHCWAATHSIPPKRTQQGLGSYLLKQANYEP